MKRDDDLLRKMLFEFEDATDYLIYDRRLMNMTAEERNWQYHLYLLHDQRFVTKITDSGYRLTSEGHDFIEAVRSDTVWKKTKDGAQLIGGATLGMIRDIAIGYLKQEVTTRLGLSI